MSRLTDELRAKGFTDRSDRDLTWEYGQFLEANKRDDIFNANPDFAAEYHQLKDEIQRAKRPTYTEEFKGAFGSAVDSLQATGYGVAALAAHGAAKIGVPGAESARSKLLDLMREQETEAAQYQPSVGSFDEISSKNPIEDTARYLTYGAGTVLPSIVQAAGSGVAGAAIGAAAGSTVAPGPGTAGGAVGGALLGLAERKLAQKALSALLERGAKNLTLEQVAKALPRAAVEAEAKRLAISIGSQTALAASSIAAETGSIYGENPDAPGTALMFGTAAGLLDVLPEAYVLGKFFGPGQKVGQEAARGARAYFRQFAEEAAKTIPMEGSTEAAQTLLEIAASKFGRGEEATSFTSDDYRQAVNAGLLGAIGGAVMAPAAAVGANRQAPNFEPLADSVVQSLPLQPGEIDASPGGAMDFGSGNDLPEFGPAGVIDRQTAPGTQRSLVEAERVGREGFSPIEDQPYQLGSQSAAPLPNLPKGVEKAVEAAERAARAWEVQNEVYETFADGSPPVEPREFAEMPAQPPVTPGEMEQFRPPSSVVTDAPLGNLIGRQVEYAGYRGELVRDPNGNFLVLPPARPNTKPFWIEVADTGKDPSMLASTARVVPLEPANMTPKPAPAVPIPGGNLGRPGAPRVSRVPLGALFPDTMIPRQDINPIVNTVPGTVAGIPPQPAAPIVPPPAAAVQTVASPAGTSAGGTNVVEQTQQSKLAHEAQVALWKQKNKVRTGRAFQFATLPGGARDLLNEIFDLGGVRPPGEGAGGEYDEFGEVFGGSAKILVRKSGSKIDDLADQLGYRDVEAFKRAIQQAKADRKRAFQAFGVQRDEQRADAQTERFRAAAIENKSRPKSQAGKPKPVDDLRIGDRFKIKREPFEVVDIDEEGNVIINDGPRFGRQKLAPGEVIYPDKRTLRLVPREEASFLDEDAATDFAPTEPAAAPGELPGTNVPLSLTSDEQANPEAPAIPEESTPEMFGGETRGMAPTAMDRANEAAREAIRASQPPSIATTPTGEQATQDAGNGVPQIPADSIPNGRKLRIFDQTLPLEERDPSEFPEGARAAKPIEAQAVPESAITAVEKMVGKQGKAVSNVAVIIIDNATGTAYQRAAYRGAKNILYFDMASARKGTAVGRGSTVSYDADFLTGTEGRPAEKVLSERAENGAQRYSLWGAVELIQGGGPRNWNIGPVAALDSHPGIQVLARQFWEAQARTKNNAQAEMPAAGSDAEAFALAMADWRRINQDPQSAAAMAQRIGEFTREQAKAYPNLTEKQVVAWAEQMVIAIEGWARTARRQAVMLSADYVAAPQDAVNLMRSAIRALTDDRSVDVVAFEQGLMDAATSAAKTTGLTLSPAGQKKIVAFAAESMRGPVRSDTVLTVLHETAHVVTDGLAEPLRVAVHEGIRQLPWQQARWLRNPRSLDVRLLANADPATLSPEQRGALEQLTAGEIAAARRMNRSALAEEQLAEHLAQLGWDKREARGVAQSIIRFVKELYFRLAMSIQQALKGPDNVAPDLARRYAENRFLQFIHRDAAQVRDRINDVMTWLGVPPKPRQLIPHFPAGNDWEMRMQYVDAITGELIPVDHGIHTPDAQTAYLKAALDNAARYVAENPQDGSDTPEIRQTRRAWFTAPLSFTPTVQINTVLASINLEAEIYSQIKADSAIGPLLPVDADFTADWLRIPETQVPEARRAAAEGWAKANQDPTTGAPITYDAEVTVDDLPSAEEKITDRDGKTVTLKLTEAQDKAMQHTIRALDATRSRVRRRLNHEVERLADLERIQKKNPADFPESSLKEITELKESIPLREKIEARLLKERNALLSKFQPGDLVHVYPTAEYLTVPSSTATEEQIRAAAKGVVPRDYKFTDKAAFGNQLAAMEAWLLNPDNRAKGQIYGIIAEQYRKLNQIPTDLERAATAGILRRVITGSFADELRASGLRALQALGKKFFEVAKIVNEHSASMKTAGARWSESFAKFAESLGESPDQSFKERVFDELMRVWNFIDVSERNKLGATDEGNLFERIEAALRTRTGIDIKSDAQRSALRGFLMQTIEGEREIRNVYERNPGLKVRDEEMGIYRRLISHGLVTGRRSASRHITGLFMQMNRVWSTTKPAAGSDARNFWESVADSFSGDRAKFDATIAELFPDYVVRDFVEPIVYNNTQVFEVVDGDGVRRSASLLNVRQAWKAADGDVTKFAIGLHELEGGARETVGSTVETVMQGFNRMFLEIKSDHDSREGVESSGGEVLPRQMMDARVANDWPAEWVSYATYSEADNLQLLHQLARSAAFGPDAISASGEVAHTIQQSKFDLDDLYYRYDELTRNGMKPAEVARTMGEADYAIARNALKIKANLERVEAAFRQMSSATNYLAGDFKLFNDALGFASTMMVQNPRGTLINTSDILGALVAMKLSRPGLKVLAQQIKTLIADFGNGVLQAFGQNSAFNTEAARRRYNVGVRDSDTQINWRTKMANMGPGQSLSAPSGYETLGAKTRRLLTRGFVKGRDIIPNLGSPFQGSSEEQSLSPKLRWGGFPNWAMSTMNANIDAASQVFTDLALRGVERIRRIPLAERAKYVRELELGVRDITAEEVGYFGGLILNDKAAFDSMRSALETKMAGEKGVGSFIAKAYRRFEAAGDGQWNAIGDDQFVDILNYANTEWTLQNNFASLPPWMQSGPLRPLFVFLTWPYNAMRRFGKTFTDPEGRLIWWGANSTVKDGLMAFFVVAAPATIAGSFAVDWYDKYLLGKRQNLREAKWTTALPVVGAFTDPAAFIERVGRYGSAGFASDIANQIINYDTQRSLSLDSRIVAVNAISSLVNSLVTTPIQQGGNVTYGSVGRPFIQAIGGGGVLQYLQILNNVLDLNTQDAAINSRINTGNYLRAAGRELNLPVRVSKGAAEAPTRSTPYLQQMELAALVNNTELFRTAYRDAVDAARIDHPENPERYVADNFTERHPLKRIFRVSPTENDYRRLLGEMDDYGAQQVRAAINSYNRYLQNWFGKKPFLGKASKEQGSVESLIRSADRINRDFQPSSSLLAIP